VETRADTFAAADTHAPVASPAAGPTTVGALTVERAGPIQAGPRNPVWPLHLPEMDDPSPNLARMVSMSTWAAVLGLLGMIVAVRTFIAIFIAPGPQWLVPTLMSLGIGGTLCAGIAFATAHRKWLPWELLGLASLLLATNLVLVITRF
jgi:hypothetical protein